MRLWDILQTRLVRRNVPVKNLKLGDIESRRRLDVRRVVTLQQGIPSDAARDIIKYLKDQKLKKVQASIQGDQLRISSASKDELQDVIRLLREPRFRHRPSVRQLPIDGPAQRSAFERFCASLRLSSIIARPWIALPPS